MGGSWKDEDAFRGDRKGNSAFVPRGKELVAVVAGQSCGILLRNQGPDDLVKRVLFFFDERAHFRCKGVCFRLVKVRSLPFNENALLASRAQRQPSQNETRDKYRGQKYQGIAFQCLRLWVKWLAPLAPRSGKPVEKVREGCLQDSCGFLAWWA